MLHSAHCVYTVCSVKKRRTSHIYEKYFDKHNVPAEEDDVPKLALPLISRSLVYVKRRVGDVEAQ